MYHCEVISEKAEFVAKHMPILHLKGDDTKHAGLPETVLNKPD